MIGVFSPDMTDLDIKAHLPSVGGPFVFYRADLWDGDGRGMTEAIVIGNYPHIIASLTAQGIKVLNGKPKIKDGNPFKGKRVALIGPAPHITKRSQVSKLKGYDVICRANLSYPVSADVARMTTGRTDVWYPSLPIIRGERSLYGQLPEYVRTEAWEHEIHDSFFPVSPIEIDLIELDRVTGCRNNRGFMAIMDILSCEPKELYITGITFYKGGAYHDGYLPDGVEDNASTVEGRIGLHDPEAQLSYFAEKIAILPQVKTDKELSRVLSEFKTKNTRP